MIYRCTVLLNEEEKIRTWYPPVRIFSFFSVFAALFASLVMWPRFMSNLFSKDSMRSFLEARFALGENKVKNEQVNVDNILSGRERWLVTLCIAVVREGKVPVLDIPPTPTNSGFRVID